MSAAEWVWILQGDANDGDQHVYETMDDCLAALWAEVDAWSHYEPELEFMYEGLDPVTRQVLDDGYVTYTVQTINKGNVTNLIEQEYVEARAAQLHRKGQS